MKITNAIILVFVCLMSVYCLQLTSHKPSLKHNFFKPSHQGLSLYAKHYLSHRTEEYIQEVKRDNLEKIEAFNAQNKEALANKTEGILTSLIRTSSFSLLQSSLFNFSQEGSRNPTAITTTQMSDQEIQRLTS